MSRFSSVCVCLIVTKQQRFSFVLFCSMSEESKPHLNRLERGDECPRPALFDAVYRAKPRLVAKPP